MTDGPKNYWLAEHLGPPHYLYTKYGYEFAFGTTAKGSSKERGGRPYVYAAWGLAKHEYFQLVANENGEYRLRSPNYHPDKAYRHIPPVVLAEMYAILEKKEAENA